MNNLIRQNALLFAVLVVSSWQFVNAHSINAQTRQRGKLTEQELKLRDELEKDSSFKETDCRGLNNEVRLLLYNAANSESKNVTVKAKKICSTLEGDPIPSYLSVNKGKITLVIDTSRDEFGSMQLYSKTCESLTLGTYVMVKDEKGSRSEFKPIHNSDKDEIKDKVSFVLRCENKQNREPTEWIF
jgi:hypothetical protein